jgi:hypothetical protein
VYNPLSTGRFARATGSGTYTATFTYNGVFEYRFNLGTLSITLSGNLPLLRADELKIGSRASATAERGWAGRELRRLRPAPP